jgi:hypothetical protein
MKPIKADLRDLDKLDIQAQGRPLTPIPPRRSLGAAEKAALKAAVSAGGVLTAQANLLKEPISVSETKPTISVLMPSKMMVGLAKKLPSFDLTLAVGLGVDAFAVVGVTGSAGLYGSTTPELGVFASAGLGWWSNVSVSVGPVITLIFGPPSDLAGVSWGVGCDVKFMVTGSIGGLLLFAMSPFRFLGIAVQLAAGVTAIPAFDITIQVSDTWTKPILK